MAKADYQAPGYTLAALEAAIDRATGYSTANTDELAQIDQAITVIGQAVATWRGRPWWWQRATGHFQTSTKTVAAAASDGATRSSNVSTITTTAAHGLQAGQIVQLSGISDSTFNGTWTVAEASSTTTFTFNQVGDDVAAATAGSGSVYVLSYPLRSIDLAGAVTATDASKIAWSAWAVQRVFYDDDRTLSPISWRRMRHNQRLLATVAAGQPYQYCISGEEPYIHLWPAASSALDIYIDVVRRHSKITSVGSTDTALIIPAEFQWGTYVQGSQWILQQERMAEANLRECPALVDTIDRMAMADPAHYRDDDPGDLFPDAQAGHLPHDRRVVHFPGGGYMIGEDVSL